MYEASRWETWTPSTGNQLERRALWDLARTSRTTIVEQILPLWSTVGTDHLVGGFSESLSPAGPNRAIPRRLRVTARQIYAFHEASRLGWSRAAAQACGKHGYRFLVGHTSAEGFLFPIISPDGEVLDRTFQLYDQAFLLFAYAHAYALLKEEDVRVRAERLLDALRSRFLNPDGGYLSSPTGRPALHANPHMHLLESALAWWEVSSDPQWKSFADEIVLLFWQRFYDRNKGVVLEDFDSNWVLTQSEGRARVEPGHNYEWAWLLMQWELLTGGDAGEAPERMIAFAEDFGYDPERRVAVNELWSDRTMKDPQARLWPQTERLKAWLSVAERKIGSDLERAEGHAADAARTLMRYLETQQPGLWHDTTLPDGSFEQSDAPASSLYHIICAIAELHRYVQKKNFATGVEEDFPKFEHSY